MSELVTRICSGYLGEWQDESPSVDDVTSDGPPDPPAVELGEGVVELAFGSRTPLAEVESRAREQGVAVAAPSGDEGFGRQLRLRSPDGLVVTINEIDAELIE